MSKKKNRSITIISFLTGFICCLAIIFAYKYAEKSALISNLKTKALNIMQSVTSKKQTSAIADNKINGSKTEPELKQKPDQETVEIKAPNEINNTNTATKPETSRQTSLYTVQIAAFKKKEDAVSLVNNLIKKEVNAFIELKDIQNNADLYRVYVGEYLNQLEARENANKLKSIFHDCFIKNI